MKHHALLVAITIIALATLVASSNRPLKREPGRRYYTLHIPRSNDIYSQEDVAETVARTLNVRMEGPVGELKSYYWVSAPEPLKRSEHENDPVLEAFKAHKEQRLNKRDEEQQQWDLVNRIDPQIPRRRYKRGGLPELQSREPPFVEINEGVQRFQEVQKTLGIKDPGFFKQWHLINQDNVGNDINVTGVWSQGITGNGSIVAILDDGLDYESRDLAENFYAAGSYDFNDHVDLPKPKLFDDTHGTRCAGQIAALKNDVCGIGIAHNAKVAGVRILSGEITDADEAAALNYKYQENDIFSCSWGPPDNGETMEAPEGILADAFLNGIENGRGGKGSIYVFATGNGAVSGDNCNFDGYTNSIYTITVGAIDHNNAHPPYSESCSAQMVVTYSSGGGQYIYTTDVGEEDCSDRHGGTSAAAPSAAGVFALVLSVRPELTWRDLQHLCVQTAIPISTDDDDWKKLPSGRLYNHKFGYGKLDAYAIVEAAKTFKLVNKQTHIELPVATSKQPIPDSSGGKKVALQSSIQVTQKMVKDAGLMRLEHVTATVNIEHQRRGDIVITLQSPNKVESELATLRPADSSPDGIRNWKFMSVKHWEENPVGEWTLLVYDMSHPDAKGSLVNWTLTLWGEQDPDFKGEPMQSPLASHSTPTATQKGHHTTSTPSTASSSTTESDHIPPRPTRVKPVTSSTSSSEVQSTTSSPSETGGAEEDNVEPAGQATSDEKSGGASTAIYAFVGSAAILTLATGLYLHRRNNWRPPSLPTDDEGRSHPDRPGGYEFTVLWHSEEDEADHDTGSPSDDRPLLNENGQPRS